MKMRSIFLIGIVSFLVAACTQPEGLIPVDLQCEYQSEPLGIDMAKLRFAWHLKDGTFTRGQRQTAYQLLVASGESLLNEEDADVWNSGKVVPEQPGMVTFQGSQLSSSTAYYWKVRVFDKENKSSAWSHPARFVTGILDPNEWKEADWIRHPIASKTKHIWFRKTVILDHTIQTAFVHVASMGHHELYVNGEKVDDSVLAPALTNFDKRLFYVTYDLSKLLRQGENTIAIWFASGWASYDCFSKTPALRVKIDGKDDNGHVIKVCSDTSWKCAVSCSEDTREVLTYNDNGGEIVDARRMVWDWNKNGFDDSSWDFAVTSADEGVVLEAQNIPPSRIVETISAKAITKDSAGVYKVDLGKNFTGWVNIKFKGLNEGDTVVIGVADDQETFVDFNLYNYFVSAGRDGEYFQNRFNYIAGRFVNIKGLRQAPQLEDITGYAIQTDLQRMGSFESSNVLFNQIYETDIQTYLANTTEGYTSDCPHRERCGYGEEATATSWGIGLPNFDAGGFYKNTVCNWRDVQTEDGWGRHTAPQPNDYHWGGAMWSSAGMNVAWEHFLHYGDTTIIELIYPTATRWLMFLDKHTEQNLLTKYRPHNGQFLGDWLAPNSRSEFGDTREAVYFNNCVYAMNLITAVKMATILGKTDDAIRYQQKLEILRAAIHDKFFNITTGKYSTGTQVQQAFALLTGVVPESECDRVTQSIVTDMMDIHPYFDMGSSGLVPLLHYLTDRPEMGNITAKILNRREYPGYGYFVEMGENTWPEDWKAEVPSKIHTCFTGIAGWMIKGLCGIQSMEKQPGYKQFVVKPMIVNEVEFAKGTVMSPYGLISSHWERNDKQTKLTVIVPPGSSAMIHIPATPSDSITENDIPLDKVNGITVKGFENNYMVVEALAGKYVFSVTSNNPILQFDDNGKFVIMQMTDIHWDIDRTSLWKIFDQAIKYVQPNLIVVTGDVVISKHTRQGWEEVIKPLANSSIPWAVTFGNHDTEHELTKMQIIDFLRTQKGNLTVNGPTNISGNGNYLLKISSAKNPKQMAAVLYCFDSRQQDNWIDFSQIDWYRQQSDRITADNKGTALPSLAFFHIPIPEFKLITGKTTTVGTFGEPVCDPPLNAGLLANFVEQKDIMGMFTGHDHFNNYIGVHHGVALAYGYATTLSETGFYCGAGRGVRVIELTEGQRKFDTWLVKICDEPEKGVLWTVKEQPEIIHKVRFPDDFGEK